MGAYLYLINKDENGDPVSPPILKTISEKKGFINIPVIKNDLGNGMVEIIKRGYIYEHSKSLQELHKQYCTQKGVWYNCYDWTDPENPVLIPNIVNKKIGILKFRHAFEYLKEDLIDNLDINNQLHRKILLKASDGISNAEALQAITWFENNYTCTSSVEYWLENKPEFIKK